MKSEKIENLREKINNLDDEILNLLDKRSEIVHAIGELKDKSKGVIDSNRENAILQRLLKKLKGHYSKDSIVRIWRELFYASTKLQINPTIDILPKRGIDNIEVYKGGKSIVHGKSEVIKLSSNENALKPSSKIYEVFKNEKSFHRYGEINGESLRKQISKVHSINEDQIILGNGSNEILLMTALSFCHPGDEIIHSRYGFEMYPIITKIVGAISVIADESNYKISIDSIIKNISNSTKLILIDNPNNPTGTYLNKDDLEKLLNKIPKNIIVVIDGAYAEYVNENNYDKSFDLIKRFENVIITRTFSKVYGLAGMRLGWCYTSNKIGNILNKVKPPFNGNRIVLQMASAALEDVEHLEKTINENKRNREWFQQELEKLNIKCLPSEANFIFIESKNAKIAEKIFNLLFENGIIVRQLNSYGLPNCLRITIGTRSEMEKTADILIKGQNNYAK